jgi:hypothetical protein
LENRPPADQLDHPALRLIAARPDLFARQGHVAASYRRRAARTFGPYYRLSYRQNGRQCSVYLGVAGPLIERVRQAIDALQRPGVQHRALLRLRRSIRASLRAQKLDLAALLRPLGLRLKGFEVRGWRFSPFRSLFPRRRRYIPRLIAPNTASLRRNHDPVARMDRFLAARDGQPPP